MVRIYSDGVVLQSANTQLIYQKRDILKMLYRIIIFLEFMGVCYSYSIFFLCINRRKFKWSYYTFKEKC